VGKRTPTASSTSSRRPPQTRERSSWKVLLAFWQSCRAAAVRTFEAVVDGAEQKSVFLYCDELAVWANVETVWDMAQFGLRLGAHPKCVITTTPRPSKFLKALIASPGTILTRTPTSANAANLSPVFLSHIVSKYQGTRLGRQELMGELLEDNPGALFHQQDIDNNRVERPPQALQRIVVSIDPSGSKNASSDECGITVCGPDDRTPAHYFVLADLSLKASPDTWA
jgi:phage terminase large subunit-like protein